MARKTKSVLSADRDLYRNPDTVRQIPWIRKEYTRLKSIANKRIARLEKAGYAETDMVREYKGFFTSARGMSTDDIADIMPELSYFLESSLSTVKGMREYTRKQVQTLNDSGYDFVNEGNFQQWASFMDQVHEFFSDAWLYESVTIETKGQSTTDTIKQVKTRIVKEKFDQFIKVGGWV